MASALIAMFKEYLKGHPLSDIIATLPRCPFPPARDRAAWEALPLDKLARLVDEYRETEYPVLKASAFMAFGRNGDRAVYETPYFLRRRKLCAAALGVCAGGDFADLDEVIDGLWLICEESSWVISAHNGSAHEGQLPASQRLLPDVSNPYVDLFSAQTAMILSMTCDLLSDELDAVSPLIRRRVRHEIETRVLHPFETRDDFWWMGITRKDLCNWTPWIVSNVMLTACAWVRDRLRLCEILTRGCMMLDRYLDVIPEDGGCDEGAGYWSMAGGALLDCLELLESVTEGRMTFWNDPKLRNLLRFPLNAWLGGDWFVNTSDCDARPAIPGERLRFAGEKLNDPALMALGARFEQSPADHLSDTPQLWRLLKGLFHPCLNATAAEPSGDVWLPDMQLRVVRRSGMSLAVKGGVNEGSHNHNDCGGFMLYADGEPQIVDAGNMTYTGLTFSDQRYTLWNTRSLYHNVPLIGGAEQVNGWARKAKDVQSTPNGLIMDISGAYPIDRLVCKRSLSLDGCCLLRDEIHTETPMQVTEVFMLRHRPTINNSEVVAGGIRIIPETAMTVGMEEIPVTDPRMAWNFPGSLWRVTFTDAPAKDHLLTFHIERT